MNVIIVGFAGLLSAGLLLAKPAVDPAAVCALPAGFHADLELDGNTNTVLSGRTDYPALQEVKILIHRPNPFKYNYRTTYTARVLESEAVAQFLQYLGLPPADAPAGGGATGSGVLSADPSQCKAAGDRFRADAIRSVKQKLEAARKALTAKRAEVVRINDFVSAISGDSINNCNAVVVEAGIIRQLLQTVGEVSQLETLIAEAESALSGDEMSLAEQLNKWGESNSQCDGTKSSLAKEIDTLKQDIEKTRKAVDQVKDALVSEELAKTRRALSGRIEAVLTTDHPFYYRFSLPNPTEPTQFDITGAKQEMFPSAGQMVVAAQVVKVTVGRPRFTLSAGIGATSLGERNVVRQAGTPDGAQVFGYDKNSSVRPALVVLGTGHIYNFKSRDMSFGLSTGFLLGSQAGSANFEYVLGPSFGFLRNLMIVTPGMHIGKRQHLAQFSIGSAVPDKLTDPLPIENNWRPGFMISITFRVR